MKKFLTICALALVGCGAFSPSAKMQEDALALAYTACTKDAEVAKAAEQAGMSPEQMCAIVMNAVLKQLQEKAACDGGESGSCSAG